MRELSLFQEAFMVELYVRQNRWKDSHPGCAIELYEGEDMEEVSEDVIKKLPLHIKLGYVVGYYIGRILKPFIGDVSHG
jgi:hypothetical protein